MLNDQIDGDALPNDRKWQTLGKQQPGRPSFIFCSFTLYIVLCLFVIVVCLFVFFFCFVFCFLFFVFFCFFFVVFCFFFCFCCFFFLFFVFFFCFFLKIHRNSSKKYQFLRSARSLARALILRKRRKRS